MSQTQERLFSQAESRKSSDAFDEACKNSVERAFNLHVHLIEHENELINQRMTWLLFFNAFLFAALALLSQANIGKDAVFIRMELVSFAVLIALVGFGTSYLALRSIKAAMDSIRALKDHWVLHFEPIEEDLIMPGAGIVFHAQNMAPPYPRVSANRVFPHIIGGGPNYESSRRGLGAPVWIVSGLSVIWSVIGTYLLVRISLMLTLGWFDVPDVVN